MFAAASHAQGPPFDFVVQIGAGDVDYATGVTVDLSGNVYTKGAFSGTVDFDPDPLNTAEMTSVSLDFDTFIHKLDSAGNLVWAKSIGGAGATFGIPSGVNDREVGAITTDAAGNVYITGAFKGTVDFDPDPVAKAELTGDGNGDAYIAKYDMDGNLLWVRRSAAQEFAQGLGIAVDNAGNVLTTGSFSGTVDFDRTRWTRPPNGHRQRRLRDGYFRAQARQRRRFPMGQGDGGVDQDSGKKIAVDSAENAYITGNFLESVDFDPGAGEFILTSSGITEAYILKLSRRATSAGRGLWEARAPMMASPLPSIRPATSTPRACSGRLRSSIPACRMSASSALVGRTSISCASIRRATWSGRAASAERAAICPAESCWTLLAM